MDEELQTYAIDVFYRGNNICVSVKQTDCSCHLLLKSGPVVVEVCHMTLKYDWGGLIWVIDPSDAARHFHRQDNRTLGNYLLIQSFYLELFCIILCCCSHFADAEWDGRVFSMCFFCLPWSRIIETSSRGFLLKGYMLPFLQDTYIMFTLSHHSRGY